MNLKKKIKGFFTLTRKADGGFTLVELIVVIAILAILAGVAVPAYSAYVTKANKQADISLVSDIEHALTLAFYRGDFAEGDAGFLLLSPNEGESFVNEDDEGNLGPIAIALENSFGTNWLDMMQLKYGSWEAGYTLLSYEEATTVVNSNFVQKYSPTELMEQVQIMTTAANGLNLQRGDTQVGLYDLFNYSAADGATQNMVMDVMKEYGIGDSTADWNSLSAEEKSNVLVLATASSVANGTNSLAVTAITDYSLYTAYAAENADFNEAYKAFQEKINNVTPDNADAQYSQIKAAYNELKAAAGADYDAWKTTNKTATEQAFKAVMAGVGNAMKDNGDAIIADLGNANMFTAGIGNEMYNDYLSSALATAANGEGIAEVLGAMEYGVFPGAVLVQYAVVDGNLHVANSLPVK